MLFERNDLLGSCAVVIKRGDKLVGCRGGGWGKDGVVQVGVGGGGSNLVMYIHLFNLHF